MVGARPVLCSALISERNAAGGKRVKVSDSVREIMRGTSERRKGGSEVLGCPFPNAFTWNFVNETQNTDLTKIFW